MPARQPPREYPPGMSAPSTGTYEQRNVLGSPTGVRISVSQGDVLPAAPRGFTWRLIGNGQDS